MGSRAEAVRTPHLERPWLTDPVRTDPGGVTGPTPSTRRGPCWRRTSRGLYVPAEVDNDVVEQRILEAAAVLPLYGGVTGWAALRWFGGFWFTGDRPAGVRLPVDLAIGGERRIRSQPGVWASTERLVPADLTSHDGITLTSAVRAVCYAMRYAPSLAAAVIALDMAAYNDLVSIAELAEYADNHPGWTGIPQCREAIPLADENSWSPQETRLRGIWSMADDLPRPLTNRPVFDLDGRHLGTPDLFDAVAGLAVEYDGDLHLEGTRRAADLDREALMRAHGIETLVFLAGHLNDPPLVLDRLRQARHQALGHDRRARAWTVERPPWWEPTHSVALRRALTDRQRTRLLRYRRSAA